MEEKKDLIEKPKINVFQRIRKAFFLLNFKVNKYKQAPEYLKEDDDVINRLLAEKPVYIRHLSDTAKIRVINANKEFFNYLDNQNQKEIVEKYPKYIILLDKNIQRELVNTHSEYITLVENDFAHELINVYEEFRCIRYLPMEQQVKYLTEATRYGIAGFVNPSKFESKLEYFSPEAIINAFSIDKNSENRQLDKHKLDKLPMETQLELASMDNRLFVNMSKEARVSFLNNNNPMLFKNVPEEFQIEFLRQNPQYLRQFSYEIQRTYLNENPEATKYASMEVVYSQLFSNPQNLKFDSVDDIKRVMVQAEGEKFHIAKQMEIIYNTINKDWLVELGKFNTSILMNNYLGTNNSIIEYLTEMYSSYLRKNYEDKSESIIEEIQNSLKADKKFDKRFEILSKIILNTEIMSKCSAKKIAHYIKTPGREKLIEIIREAYGEKASQILEERKNIDIQHIPNLYIFDGKVLDEFGIGIVHNCISYENDGASVVSELARISGEIENYRKFEKLVGDYFSDTAYGLEQKLIAFNNYSQFLRTIDIDNLTEKQKRDFLLSISDTYEGERENQIVNIEALEDLDKYSQIRNSMYDDAITKATDAAQLKGLIFKKYFGMEYESSASKDRDTTMNDLSVRKMISFYNLESFVNHPKTLQSGMFSKDELDSLELLSIISKIEDENTLKQINEKLRDRQDILTPVDFKETKEKVSLQYSKELIDSLFTLDGARDKFAKGEQGIEISKEDDVEIVKLNGTDFRILMHVAGKGNSELGSEATGDIEQIWKYYENGMSTISGSIIEAEMLHSVGGKGNVILGFTSVNPIQILGMGHADIHTTHDRRQINPAFQFGHVKFNYSGELVRKTAAQITGIETKDSHKYNEVAILRREQRVEDIKEETFGGRIMPDYIVAYDELTNEQKDLAKRFNIPIIQIDTKAYGDRTYERAQKGKEEIAKREQTEFIEQIKETVERKDNNEGR